MGEEPAAVLWHSHEGVEAMMTFLSVVFNMGLGLFLISVIILLWIVVCGFLFEEMNK